ncbi:MHS family MFS transporter [Bacillus thuringiensis]|uniref:MFS transporter n=1 Tax=Bacillus thuringiensis TaxID=1428 RepID=UPI00125EDE80|nr:MFS transporter [Bacillus thuringiensis]KAB5639406.1 MHS family MFS transporter [Bacillus thuringiensis]HDR5272053.1 MHS family MFS transporter [Bacillus thuringiensis]
MNDDKLANTKSSKKAATAATVGTVIEFYDFFLYATAAAIVFPKVFFPESNSYLGVLQSFGTLAVGFLARPIGAIIFGHFGDRIGRKASLVSTMFLMGLSSLAIGLLPSYESIGLWAPILLIIMRLIQGVGVGGEWGGSVLLSMESGNRKQQAFMASLPQMGVAIGLLLASGMVSVFTYISGDNFYTWGWRIPFIFSVILLVAGFLIRLKIPETPSFRHVQANKRVSRLPVVEVIKKHPKTIFLTALLRLSENGPFYVYTVFIMNYAMESFQIDKISLLNVNLLASLFMMLAIPLFGFISDKIGIKRVYIIGVGITFFAAIPYMKMINNGTPDTILIATILVMIPHSMQIGAQGAFVAKSFPIHLRYSGISLGSQIGSIISGGIAPLICAFLVNKFGSSYAISGYIICTAIITFAATLLIRDYTNNKLKNVELNQNIV